MQEALGLRSGGEPFGEKDFYLEELRGRSGLVALAPRVGAERAPLEPLADTVAELMRNGTRVLVWWPAGRAGTERRLLKALGRHRRPRKTSGRREPSPVVDVKLGNRTTWDGEGLSALVWQRLRRRRLCILSVTGQVASAYPDHVTAIAVELRVPKVVLVEPDGGLVAGGSRLSFVDGHVLDTLLGQGEAEWTGLGERRRLLVAVDRTLVEDGVESVNLCTPSGIAEELFSYGGSGTLFTVNDYCRVRPLALDEFAQAERLLERGQREGLLKFRQRGEVAQVLATAYGATICDRHLAGVAGLLTAPYVAERAGEFVGLYTINRFKGEGLGERLVDALLAEANRRELAYVFACTIDDRAALFFERTGFKRVGPTSIPSSKWIGYDKRRRARVATFRRELRFAFGAPAKEGAS
jgi:N-acetylglutamate synthase-like GNAT family acetyltransferase